MKLVDVREKFLQSLKDKNRSRSTILAYGKDIEQLIESTDKEEIESLEKKDIEAFKKALAQKDYTNKSISRKINAVKSFFRFSKREGLVKTDPASAVSHPQYETKPPRVLTQMEYRALRDAARADTRMAAIIELLLQTGMRIGELFRLKIDHLHLKKGSLTIQAWQSQEARKVPLNAAAKKALKNYLKKRPPSKHKNIFLTKTGNPFLIRNIRASINRYFKAAGINDAMVNDLRNTFIVHQLRAGLPLTTVAKIVGHKRISTTEKYLELVEEKGKERVKLEEL